MNVTKDIHCRSTQFLQLGGGGLYYNFTQFPCLGGTKTLRFIKRCGVCDLVAFAS